MQNSKARIIYLGILFIPIFLAAGYYLLTTTAFAQLAEPIPKPYVQCSDYKEPQWNSLRPYQASPCKIPIDNTEQALLCGKDFILTQTFTTDVNSPYCDCSSIPCPGSGTCHCEVPKEFDISINAFDSELPIAGNTQLIADKSTSSIAELPKKLSDWEGRLPPDPADFASIDEYNIAYQQWRGKYCPAITIPLINKKIYFCVEDPTNPNYYSNLFPYIPYSSTEDKIGKTWASDMIGKPLTDFKITNLDTAWKEKLQDDPRNKNTQKQEGVLYFPHMEENVELSTLLQSTFVSQDSLKSQKALSIKKDDVADADIGNACTILDVRSNPGDQLFGEQIDEMAKKSTGAPAAKVNYTAVFDCPAVKKCVSWVGGVCLYCVLEGECTNTGQFTSTIDTYTPMADELWANTVAGNSSVFRKMFPKVGEGAPLDKIKDIPAASNVEYNPSGEGVNLKTQNPQLYFPHFGGMYDYFLKDIQTLLRPQGFAEGPAGLSPNSVISEPDRVNEYLSWYLNGTIYRAEDLPLDVESPEDELKLVNFSGPLNKLLPQAVQWRAKIQQPQNEERISRVAQVQRQDEQKPEDKRHDQIVACTRGIKISWPVALVNPLFVFLVGKEIGGIPIPCSQKSLASVGNIPQATSTPATPGEIDCDQNIPDSSIPSKYLQLKQNFVRMADTYGTENFAEECFNDVVKQSLAAGVNPAFSLAIWLHESGASNYSLSVQDFGINDSSVAGFQAQISAFLQLPFSYSYTSCKQNYTWREGMEAFLSKFKAGECNPNNTSGYNFYQNMKWFWQVVNDPVAYCLNGDINDPHTTFKISWPTDKSCP